MVIKKRDHGPNLSLYSLVYWNYMYLILKRRKMLFSLHLLNCMELNFIFCEIFGILSWTLFRFQKTLLKTFLLLQDWSMRHLVQSLTLQKTEMTTS